MNKDRIFAYDIIKEEKSEGYPFHRISFTP